MADELEIKVKVAPDDVDGFCQKIQSDVDAALSKLGGIKVTLSSKNKKKSGSKKDPDSVVSKAKAQKSFNNALKETLALYRELDSLGGNGKNKHQDKYIRTRLAVNRNIMRGLSDNDKLTDTEREIAEAASSKNRANLEDLISQKSILVELNEKQRKIIDENAKKSAKIADDQAKAASKIASKEKSEEQKRFYDLLKEELSLREKIEKMSDEDRSGNLGQAMSAKLNSVRAELDTISKSALLTSEQQQVALAASNNSMGDIVNSAEIRNNLDRESLKLIDSYAVGMAKIADDQEKRSKKDWLNSEDVKMQLGRADALLTDAKNISALRSYREELEKVIEELGEKNIKAEDAAKKLDRLEAEMRDVTKTTGILSDVLGGSVTNIKRLFVAFTTIDSASDAVREMVNRVIELDKCMVNLRIASGKSASEVAKLMDAYHDLGKDLGATTTEVAEGADTWLRQGYSAAESTKLIADSMMLSKLGQLDSAEASDALTSAMKGYGVEVDKATSIVDKFVTVDMKAAISAGDIASAMSETAVSANVAGISMDRLIGYLATVGEVTQDSAQSVGNFMKTLTARMGSIKAGRLVDPETEEDLSNVETTLANVGIMLRSEESGFKEFRNFASVLDEVAEGWSNYSSVQQRAIAGAFAGTRQQEKFLVLMENYDRAIELTTDSVNSAGTAIEKYNAYLDSAGAKIKGVQSAIYDLSDSFVDSNLVGNVLGAAEGILEFVTKIIDAIGAFAPTALLFGGGSIVKNGLAAAFKSADVSAAGLFATIIKGGADAKKIFAALLTGLKGSLAALGKLSLVVGVAVGVSKLADYLINLDKRRYEDAVAAAQAKQEEAAALESEVESLDEIADRYAEVRSNAEDSKDVAKELVSLQESLNGLIGIEAKDIDLVNGNLDDELATLKDISAEKRKQLILSLQQAAAEKGAALDSYGKDSDFNRVFNPEEAKSVFYGESPKDYKVIGDLWRIGYDISEGFMQGRGNILISADGKSAEEQLAMHKELFAELDKRSPEELASNNLTGLYNALVAEISALEQEIDAVKNAEKELIKAVVENHFLSDGSIDEVHDVVGGYNIKHLSESEISQYVSDLISALNSAATEGAADVGESAGVALTENLGKALSGVSDDSKVLKTLIAALGNGKAAFDALFADIEGGNDTLSSLLATFPGLEQELKDYAAGVIDTSDLMAAFNAELEKFKMLSIKDQLDTALDWRSSTEDIKEALRQIKEITGIELDVDADNLIETLQIIQAYVDGDIDAFYEYSTAAMKALGVKVDPSNIKSAFEMVIQMAATATGALGEMAKALLGTFMGVGAITDNPLAGLRLGTDDERTDAELLAARYQINTDWLDRYTKTSGSSGSGSSLPSAYKEQKAELEHLRNMDIISEAEYYRRLEELANKYIAGKDKYIDEYRSVLEAIHNYEKSLLEEQRDAQIEAAEKANEAAKRAAEERYEAERKALEKRKDMLDEELDAIKDNINKQKDLLEKQSSAHDYEKDVAESNANILRLESEIEVARLDNSAKGKAKLAELEKELAEEKEALEEKMYDRNTEMQKDALDEQLDYWENYYDKLISVVEENLDRIADAYDELISRLEASLESQINSINATYNSQTIGITPASGSSSSGNSLVMALQEFLNSNVNAGLKVDGILGKKTVSTLQSYLNVFGGAGIEADGKMGPKTRAAIQNAVQSGLLDPKFLQLHTGGMADSSKRGNSVLSSIIPIDRNEVLAKLLKNEAVLTSDQQSMSKRIFEALVNSNPLFSMGANRRYAAAGLGPNITFQTNYTVSADLTDASMRRLEELQERNQNAIKQGVINSLKKIGRL